MRLEHDIDRCGNGLWYTHSTTTCCILTEDWTPAQLRVIAADMEARAKKVKRKSK
jgi:hypothetical protein